MSIHKITPFLSDIKDFFKNSDMTAAMQSISSVLTQVKMTERDTLAVTSKRNCVYRLLTVFQCLLLFPCFGIRNAYRNQKHGILEPLIKARCLLSVYGKSRYRLEKGSVAYIRPVVEPHTHAFRP